MIRENFRDLLTSRQRTNIVESKMFNIAGYDVIKAKIEELSFKGKKLPEKSVEIITEMYLRSSGLKNGVEKKSIFLNG